MIRALPDLLSTSLFSRVTSELRNDLDRAALEAVTGTRSDITAATNGRNGQVHRAQMAIDQSQATQTRLALITGRYNQSAVSLQTVREAVNNKGVEAMQAATANDRAGLVASANTANSTLGVIFSALNNRFDGRALFAGDAAATDALGDLDTMKADISAIVTGAGTPADKRAAIDAYFGPGGTFETTIYKGGSNDAAKVTLPNGYDVPALQRADSTTLRDMMKGLTMVANAIKLPPQDIVDWVRQGADLIRSSQDELAIAEAELGDSLNRIDEAAEKEKADYRIASETLDRIIGRDAFEAATETQNLEIRLEAAYTLTSRLGRLSLTNYLR
ncbi:flagellin [Parvularcula sp. LCG005]|uniref:flagellin n=1 Tax=Parvularcula sp. LCG005 TaxID=3078805 RepID=UPI002941FE5C|nr:flagellin [Parvularcula sp. LCG005]WOI52935.1 flagellin [Parvularcula sp. LCG005]